MEIFPVFRYLCCLLPHRVKVNIYNRYTLIFNISMRKHLLLLAALLMIGLGATAQKKKSQTSGNKQYQVYAVGFYNQENLFDTCHDAGKNDYEYLLLRDGMV